MIRNPSSQSLCPVAVEHFARFSGVGIPPSCSGQIGTSTYFRFKHCYQPFPLLRPAAMPAARDARGRQSVTDMGSACGSTRKETRLSFALVGCHVNPRSNTRRERAIYTHGHYRMFGVGFKRNSGPGGRTRGRTWGDKGLREVRRKPERGCLAVYMAAILCLVTRFSRTDLDFVQNWYAVTGCTGELLMPVAAEATPTPPREMRNHAANAQILHSAKAAFPMEGTYATMRHLAYWWAPSNRKRAFTARL